MDRHTRDLLEDAAIVFINSDKLGHGSDELGDALMRSFLNNLSEAEMIPNGIIFMNSGVNLVVQNSKVLESLEKLSDRGIVILACGTCLEYYGLKDKTAVGVVSNMRDITEAFMLAEKVVTI